MEVCSWCGYDRKNLFLCDDCPRAFCERCVAVAHGGCQQGADVVRKLLSDDNHWSCITCKPPSTLEAMKKWMLDNVDQDDNGSTDNSIINLTYSDEDDDHVNRSQPNEEETIESLIAKLMLVEDEREKADRMLEEEGSKKIYEEMRNEIEEENLGKDAAKEKLEEDFHTWKKLWKEQHERSVNAIGILQDQLGTLTVIIIA